MHHGLWPSASPSVSFITHNALGFAEAGAAFELVAVRNTEAPVAAVLAERFGIRRPLDITLLGAGPFRRQHRVVHLLAAAHLLRSPWDVLITRNLGFLPWALRLRRLRGGRVLFESHDFYWDPALRGIPEDGASRKRARQERRYLHRVDGILCVSEQQHQYYRLCDPALRLLTAVSGVVTRPRRAPVPGAPPAIGYTGTFDAGLYDFDLLLAAFALVRVPGARLLLVGARSAAEVTAMQDLARRHGVEERVEVLPWQIGPELEALLARISVGVAPLRINGRNRIGSPLKVLEYLSAGIPVVASDLPGIRYLVGEGRAGRTPAAEPAAWADALSAVLTDGALAARLSAAGLATAEDLSWSRRAARILDFIDTLTPRPAARG